MHTTNSYPCPDENINLNCIKTLQNFSKKVLYRLFRSFHRRTSNTVFSLIRSKNFRKHFTDSLKRPGPDIKCSMDPKMCKIISKKT